MQNFNLTNTVVLLDCKFVTMITEPIGHLRIRSSYKIHSENKTEMKTVQPHFATSRGLFFLQLLPHLLQHSCCPFTYISLLWLVSRESLLLPDQGAPNPHENIHCMACAVGSFSQVLILFYVHTCVRERERERERERFWHQIGCTIETAFVSHSKTYHFEESKLTLNIHKLNN